MKNSQKIRVLVLEDDTIIRESLTKILTGLGYDVYSYSTPAVCPLQELTECRCGEKQTCIDIIVSDLEMPIMSGLDFIEGQRTKRCKCQKIAIMSGNITQEAQLRANALNIKLIKKPFSLEVLFNWLNEVEKDINEDRELLDWFLK
jgi:two-component system, response regulator YesN